ncbi:hypothetical protein Emag_004236 [Eimeria magna]
MWEAALGARDLALGRLESTQPASPSAASNAGVSALHLQQQLLLGAGGPLQQQEQQRLVLPDQKKLEGGEDGGGVWISPIPCFVLKKHLKEGKKVFLNLCGHDKIERWHHKELLVGNQQKEGIRIPISIGPWTLPPPPQRIRLTREAQIEPLSPTAAATTAAGGGGGGGAAAAAGGREDMSLASFIVWDAWFVSPQDAADFCSALHNSTWGSPQTHRQQQQQQQQEQEQHASSNHPVPWLPSWAQSSSSNINDTNSSRSSSSSNTERFISVESLDEPQETQKPGSSPCQATKPQGLKKAFLVAGKETSAAAHCSVFAAAEVTERLKGRVYVVQLALPRAAAAVSKAAAAAAAAPAGSRCLRCSQQKPRCCCRGPHGPHRKDSLEWEFSLAFPLRLSSGAAVAVAAACSSCAEAKRQLLQHEAPVSVDTPHVAAAFLLTVFVPLDDAAETAFATLVPQAAAAAAEAAAAAAAETEAAPASSTHTTPSLSLDSSFQRVHVQIIKESDSSEDEKCASDTDTNSSSSSSCSSSSSSSCSSSSCSSPATVAGSNYNAVPARDTATAAAAQAPAAVPAGAVVKKDTSKGVASTQGDDIPSPKNAASSPAIACSEDLEEELL